MHTLSQKNLDAWQHWKTPRAKIALLYPCYFSSLETFVLFPGWKKNCCSTDYILSMGMLDFDSFFSVCCFTQSLFQPSWKVTKRWKVARKPRTFVFFPSKNTERNRNYHLFLLFENCGNFCTSNDLNFLHFAYVWVQAQEAKCQVGLQNSVTFLALGQYKTCTNCWNTNKACTFSEYGDATQLYHLSSKLFLLCSQLENRAIMFSSDEVEKLSKHAFTTLLSLRNKFLQLFEWLKDDDDHKFEHPKEKPQETNFWENVYPGDVVSVHR